MASYLPLIGFFVLSSPFGLLSWSKGIILYWGGLLDSLVIGSGVWLSCGGGLLGLSCHSFSRLLCGSGSIARPSPTLKSDRSDVGNRVFESQL